MGGGERGEHGREEMNEDREAQRKAVEKREQLVEMKSVHWCVLISTVSLCHIQGVSLSDD